MISSLELARLCGVSQGTVDRALHGRSGVAEATRERILRVAAEHGYLPNPAARELMGRSASILVGAVVPEPASDGIFFSTLLATLSRRLRKDGLRLVAIFATDAADQEAAAAELAARRLRALVLIHPDPTVAPPARRAFPHLSLVQRVDAPDLPALLPDEVATGRIAAEHLLAKGHRRLVHWQTPSGVGRDRCRGFLETCTAAGVEATAVRTLDETIAAIRSGATAAFCHNDPQAAALISRLAGTDLRVGSDVAVVGVDGAGLLPGLTTVAYPFAAVADGVAAWLVHPLADLPRPVGKLVVGTTG